MVASAGDFRNSKTVVNVRFLPLNPPHMYGSIGDLVYGKEAHANANRWTMCSISACISLDQAFARGGIGSSRTKEKHGSVNEMRCVQSQCLDGSDVRQIER